MLFVRKGLLLDRATSPIIVSDPTVTDQYVAGLTFPAEAAGAKTFGATLRCNVDIACEISQPIKIGGTAQSISSASWAAVAPILIEGFAGAESFAYALLERDYWKFISTTSLLANKTSGTTSVVSVTGAVGDFQVFVVAKDNAGTVDGQTNEVTGMSDAIGNTYVKAGEYQNARGAAAGGAVVAIFYCFVAVAQAATNVTVQYSSSVAAKVITMGTFNGPLPLSTFELYAIGTNLGVNRSLVASTVSVPTSKVLVVEGFALEGSTSTALTVSTNFLFAGGFTEITSSGGSGTTNIGVRAQYVMPQGQTSITGNATVSGYSGDHATLSVALREIPFVRPYDPYYPLPQRLPILAQ